MPIERFRNFSLGLLYGQQCNKASVAEGFTTQMDAYRKQAAENRRRLVPIVETVHYCTKQGLAFRAHRDHGHLLVEEL